MEEQQVLFIGGAESFSNYENFLEHLRTVPIDPFQEPSKRWSKTLAEDLGDQFEVIVPTMPNKQNAKYEEWKIWFERHLAFLHDDVILVGWSQGGYFFIKYLIENTTAISIRALIIVAAPFEPEDFRGEDGGDFAFDTSRISDVAEKADQIVIMHSRDDFVVPYEHALKYKEALPEAELISFEDKNHFLVEELPELLAKIREIAKS